jgi:predicted RNA-binding protein with PUA-like domain
MAYWLMKSEPEVFSIDDLKRDKTTGWSGVRNYEARNNMRKMKRGDLAFFYHSNAKPTGVVGIMEISKEAYEDESPTWSQVEVRFQKAFARVIALEDLRKIPELSKMALFNRSQLSVQPVTEAEWKRILKEAA